MAPVAISLDLIQLEAHAYAGNLLPTITMRLLKLDKLKSSNNVSFELANAMINGVKARFDAQMHDSKLIMAACLHPEFKMTWVSDENRKKEIKSFIVDEIRSMNDADQSRLGHDSSSDNEQ